MTPLNPSHAPMVSAIHYAAFEADGFRGWSIEECAEMVEREEYFGWMIERTAFILLRNISVEEAEIIALATQPTHQRQGLAKQLIKHALAQSPDTTFHLEVRETNAPARALYVSLGFTETGMRPSYYKDGKGGRVNAIMMTHQKD